jgi:CheY-like chemotaxis protein
MGRTVLVVEDYEDSRHFMKFMLESYGYRVFEAADGLEAVESSKDNCPDLILMDISMPVMDGLTATKTIRKFKRGGDVPIIAVTAHGKQFEKKVREAGCNELIGKPIDFDEFETVVRLEIAVFDK